MAKNSPADVGDAALIPGPGRAPEEGNGNPLSILAWRIPCTEEPSALQSISSAAQSCLTLYDPMDCSRPGLPVHHQLPEFTQTHVHLVSDAIQSSHPLLPSSPLALNLFPASGSFQMSQFFSSGGQSIGVSALASVYNDEDDDDKNTLVVA